MALALHVTVARRAGERLRRDVEHAVVEDVQDVHAGQPATRVASAGVKDEPQHRAAQCGGFQLKFVVSHEIDFHRNYLTGSPELERQDFT